MSRRFYRILKIGVIVFISAILLLLMIDIAFDIYARKLYLHLFPRPALSAEVLEDYWKNPLPMPKPIIYVETQTKNGEDLCIRINAAHLWMKGDEATDTRSSVGRSFELYIDGLYNVVMEITQEATLFILGEEGSTGGTIWACLKLTDLSTGLHSAEIQFSDTHGRLYTYIWAFRVTS